MFIDEFEFEINENIFPICEARRQKLVESIIKEFPEKKGKLCLLGNFESHDHRFIQESNFFYLTGINESACMVIVDLQTKKTTLYVGHYHDSKTQWNTQLISHKSKPTDFNIDEIKALGDQHSGLTISPRDSYNLFSNFFNDIQQTIHNNESIFILFPDKISPYAVQLFFEYMKEQCKVSLSQFISINSIMINMRMKKDEQEIARLYKAIDITITAHEAAISSMDDEISESEIQAAAEFVMTAHGCMPSFPTIVASGNNATVLHYNENQDVLSNGDLVLVDMGAQFDHYCADISRTYPISGKFTNRQRKLYEIVLEVQAKIAEYAQPGYFINNKDIPEKSLQHIAMALFREHDLEKYFVHGIGHHLGLDVHDVSHYAKPLQVGNVITIEPGLYIKEEKIGIRIEDNYWITKEGAVCLSENLPKIATDIEKLMKSRYLN